MLYSAERNALLVELLLQLLCRTGGLQQPGFGLLGQELAKQAGQPPQTQYRQPQRTGKIELLVGALMEHLQVG